MEHIKTLGRVLLAALVAAPFAVLVFGILLALAATAAVYMVTHPTKMSPCVWADDLMDYFDCDENRFTAFMVRYEQFIVKLAKM